jgi:hypothetical protein
MTNWQHADHLREMVWLGVRRGKLISVPWQELLGPAIVHYCTVLHLTYSLQIFFALPCVALHSDDLINLQK